MNTSADTLIAFGGEVKALGKGRVGGYAVLFGDPGRTDLSEKKDFFTPDTDYGLDLTTKGRVIFDHGLDPELKRATIAVADMKMDKVGVWVEGVVEARKDYAREVRQRIEEGIPHLVEAKQLGWSTGTAAHLVERARHSNGAHEIKSWPLGLDLSLTPTPAEPRTLAVAIKSLAQHRAARAGLPDGLRLGEHLDAVRDAAGVLTDRLARYAATKAADRRPIPPGRLAEIKRLRDALDGLLAAGGAAAPDDTLALEAEAVATLARLACL